MLLGISTAFPCFYVCSWISSGQYAHRHGGSLLRSSCLGQGLEALTTLELGILDDSGISIAREVAGPLDEGRLLELAAGDGVGAHGAHHRAVGELWLGGDDGVGDVVVDGAVLFLLDLNHGTILEGPLDDVGVWRGALGLETER
jgi:hypothetical protein